MVRRVLDGRGVGRFLGRWFLLVRCSAVVLLAATGPSSWGVGVDTGADRDAEHTVTELLLAGDTAEGGSGGDERGGGSGTGRVNSSGKYDNMARSCGKQKQDKCKNEKKNGISVCGRAIREMIQCMAENRGLKGCNGNCGRGRDYVKCSNKALIGCGYMSLKPTDSRCKQAGAIRAYGPHNRSKNGRIYGHTEFVCGTADDPEFCSVYKHKHSRPWPKDKPDGCWFPSDSLTST